VRLHAPYPPGHPPNPRNRILYRFFRYFSSWHFRVNEQLFLRDLYRVLHQPQLHPPPKLSHYSPMLHNAILSVAAAFADDPLVSATAARQAFADKAREALEAECDRPTLSAVIALSILANYHTSRKSPTLGYMYFGMFSLCLLPSRGDRAVS
jgi:hypothetical protein